jgi:hypothetical protein
MKVADPIACHQFPWVNTTLPIGFNVGSESVLSIGYYNFFLKYARRISRLLILKKYCRSGECLQGSPNYRRSTLDLAFSEIVEKSIEVTSIFLRSIWAKSHH